MTRPPTGMAVIIGLDIAKRVFRAQGVDDVGIAIIRRKLVDAL